MSFTKEIKMDPVGALIAAAVLVGVCYMGIILYKKYRK